MSPLDVVLGRLLSCRATLVGHAADWPPSLMALRAREVLESIAPATRTGARQATVQQAAALLLAALEAWEINKGERT